MTNNDTVSKLDTMDEQSNLEEKESPQLNNCNQEPNDLVNVESQKEISQTAATGAAESNVSQHSEPDDNVLGVEKDDNAICPDNTVGSDNKVE